VAQGEALSTKLPVPERFSIRKVKFQFLPLRNDRLALETETIR